MNHTGKSIFFNTFLLVTFLLVMAPPHAKAWKISRIKGSVQIKRQGQLIDSQKGLVLVGEDLLITHKNSRALLTEGSSKLWISQKSRLKVASLNSKKTQKPTTLDLSYGKIRALIKPEQAQKYQYKINSAVAGVRGTEFFAANDETGQIICTIEGRVEAILADGKRVTVDEGNGCNLKSGEPPVVKPNSDFLVSQWIADTAFDPEQPSVSADYKTSRNLHQLSDKNIYWGMNSTIHYCETHNADFKSYSSSKNSNCLRAHFSPALQVGTTHRLFFSPLLNIYQTNDQTNIDNFPLLQGNNRTTLAVGEAYFQTQWKGWQWRLGDQRIEWNDGVLFSSRSWSPEPISHLGLRVQGQLAGWDVDIIATDAFEKTEPLDGHTQVSNVGINFSVPDESGSIYLAHTNFGSHYGNKSPYSFGHEIINIGLFTKHRWSRSDLKASVLYQDHVRHVDATGNKGSVQDGMGELEFGFYPSSHKPIRLGLRAIAAGLNYVPVFEDYYRLGISGLVSSRGNLTQYHLFGQWQVRDDHQVFLALISSQERSADGFVRQSISTKNGATIGQEINLVYRWDIHPQHQLIVGLWNFRPDEISWGRDSAQGYLVRLSSSL